jgi:hypothetical protein
MAAIFQIRRGETNISIADGELYLHKGSGSIQFGSGSNNPITLLPLNVPAYGNIDLSGDITASNAYFTNNVRIDGNIILGDGAAGDTIESLGVFTTNLIPQGNRDIGSTDAYWRNVYATNISGAIAATNGVVSGSSQIALESINGFTTFNTALSTITGSLILSASAVSSSVWHLHQFSASAYVSFSLMTASIDAHQDDIDYIKTNLGLGGTNPIIPLQQWSASAKISIANLEAFTSSIDTTIKTKLNLDGVISGSSQIISILPSGVVSGSSQVNIYDVENFATFNDAISGDINGKEEVASATHTLVSGSSQITYASISSIPAGIVSGAAQIVPLLPTGVISGSIQILGGSGVWSSSVQMPAGVVSGSSQITYSNISSIPSGIVSGAAQIVPLLPSGVISGSSQILGGTDIHSGSTGNYRFNSIGVGLTATGVAGEIVASADIVAFSTSDIRLKENIIPIENALSKVESISGNTYDWKEGFEELHSHKGTDIGVIAQEIELILPQAVTNRESGYKAVNYEKIVPLLIEAIKELSAKIDRLENK